MSDIVSQDGKLVVRDGKLGVGQSCCCGGCPPCEGETCCNGEYPRVAGECCDGEWRLPDTGVCCGGEWHPSEEEGVCCGGVWYPSESEGECCGNVWRTEPGDCCFGETWYADGPNKCPEGAVFAEFAGHGGYFPQEGDSGQPCCGCFPETIWDPRIGEFVNFLAALEPTFDPNVGIDITPCCGCGEGVEGVRLPFVIQYDVMYDLGFPVGTYIGCPGKLCYTLVADLISDNGAPPVCEEAFYQQCSYIDFGFACPTGTPEGASIPNTWSANVCCGTCPQLCCEELADGTTRCMSPEHPEHPNPEEAGCPGPDFVAAVTHRCGGNGAGGEPCPGYCCIDGIPIEDLGLPNNLRGWGDCHGETNYYDPEIGGPVAGQLQWAGLGSTECQTPGTCRQPFTDDCCITTQSSGAGLTFEQPRYKRVPYHYGGWRVTATGTTTSPIMVNGILKGSGATPEKRCAFSVTFDLCGSDHPAEKFYVEPVPCGGNFHALDITVCWQVQEVAQGFFGFSGCDGLDLHVGVRCDTCTARVVYEGAGHTSNSDITMHNDATVEANGSGALVLTSGITAYAFLVCPMVLTLSGTSSDPNEVQGVSGAYMAGLVKAGPGTWRVSQLSFTGPVTVTDGLLEILDAPGYSGATSITGGTLVVNQIVSGPSGVVSATFTPTSLTVDFSAPPSSGQAFVLLPGSTVQSYTPVLTGAGSATATYNSATSTLTIT